MTNEGMTNLILVPFDISRLRYYLSVIRSSKQIEFFVLLLIFCESK
jgi:hypothetical protein